MKMITILLQHIAEMPTAMKLFTILCSLFSMCHYAANWCDKYRKLDFTFILAVLLPTLFSPLVTPQPTSHRRHWSLVCHLFRKF